MMKKILIFCLYLFVNHLYSQKSVTYDMNWDGFYVYTNESNLSLKYPYSKESFFNINYDNNTLECNFLLKENQEIDQTTISYKPIFEPILVSELGDVDSKLIPSTFIPSFNGAFAKYDYVGLVNLNPLIKEGQQIKRLKSITISYSYVSNNKQNFNIVNSIQNSVLSTGDWFRFYAEKSGIYKIDKAFLRSLGLNVNVDPRNIKIFGNGGNMLPIINQLDYDKDLKENAIQFIGEDDGVFNDTDYILLYVEGVDRWNSESLTSKNLYADRTYFYVTSSGGPGKRIQNAIEPTGSTSIIFSTYHNTQYYEKDLVNIAKLGRRWFGERFNVDNNQTFSFDFHNLITSNPLALKINLASGSPVNTSFTVNANSQNLGTLSFPPITNGATFVAFESALNTNFNSNSSSINIQISYDNGGVPSSNGYLDFISIKGECNLTGTSQPFLFFNENQQNNIGIGEYQITNANAVQQIWDITDKYNVTTYSNTSGANFSFKVNLGQKREYFTVTSSNLLLPSREANTRVINQNLKGTIFNNQSGQFEDIDYIIITPQNLSSAANKLANFHRQHSNMKVRVVNLESIYHEFSSGKQDVAAIRNFIRYVYENASSSSNRLKYVNLFGDASYDYKERVANNSNVVPIYHGFNPFATETNNTSNTSLVSTFMSDDFFGLMDVNEGRMLPNEPDGIDIAVGRMLVNNLQQANEMVDKVIEYHDEKSFGRWRNTYTIYSDDADTSSDAQLQVFMDDIANTVYAQKPFVNVRKIHTDAYVQEVTAGGEKYPQAKQDFLNSIELGSLVINYFGHGNEEFLARERLFERLDAQNLKNKYRYPLFITITCDFTRFDDPNRLTGGEYMYWNTNGGAIGLVATTREIFVNTGVVMNTFLAEYLYAYGSFNYMTIAEALRLAKINSGSSNRRVVSFIGDPAMKLAIPKPRVLLTEVNGVSTNSVTPTFEALRPMTIRGIVADENDQIISNFNGDIAIQIFDKNINRATLGNNGATNGVGQLLIMNFQTLGETIVRGNATVVNGAFEFTFIVPQDIRIPVGKGKVSFYAKRNSPLLEDFTGYNLDINVGGVNTNAPTDTSPPSAQLYMNDRNFVSGGVTNCSPILLAYVQDESGINTASGIGHDIVAILDGDESNPYVLNDYYETEADDFTRGIITFPFRDLEPGLHTVLLKVWDVYNNLITVEIQFNAVCSDDGLKIEKVLNYPNPFSTYTEFWFNHNMPFEPLDVQVQIFTISGKVVKTINQQVVTDGFLSREIKWDGKDDFGDRIGKGVYVYKLIVKSTSTGKQFEKYEKLVIL